jgi:hypothetical protein
LKWSKAFDGCPVLQIGSNRRKKDSLILFHAIWPLWLIRH